jgi:hypothetical protein
VADRTLAQHNADCAFYKRSLPFRSHPA